MMDERPTRLILHAGMSKTGSTAMQAAMAMGRECLRNNGVLYPTAGSRGPEHINHLALFRSAQADPPGGPNRVPLDEHLAMLRDEIAETEPSHVVLSSEFLWDPREFSVVDLDRIAGALTGFDVQVLVYLRDPVAHAHSAYKQLVKGRTRYRGLPRDYLSSALPAGVWDFDHRLSALEGAFGTGRVLAVRYEEHRSHVLRPLMSHVPPAARSCVRTQGQANPSPGWAEIRMLRWRNVATRRWPSLDIPLRYALAAGRRTVLRAIPPTSLSPFGPDDDRQLAACRTATANGTRWGSTPP